MPAKGLEMPANFDPAVPRQSRPPALAGGDVLMLGEDGPIPRVVALVLERLGARAVEIVADAEAALDVMGDDRRRWRLIVVLPPTEDQPAARLLAVLRNLRYRVHLSAIVAEAPWEAGRRPDLIGCALVSDLQPPQPLARGIAALVAGFWTIRRMVETERAPPGLAPCWLAAVYGAASGHSWSASPA